MSHALLIGILVLAISRCKTAVAKKLIREQ